MSISNSSQGITLSQQQSQGFLTLPWTPLPLSISTGFSTAFAANPTLNPFIYDATPFDRDQLSRQRFLYVRRETQGNFSSVATSSTTAGKQHTSIAFGVSIGNEYLNAGVTGSYDQSVLENQASSKTSIRCAYLAGSIRPSSEMQLSQAALKSLSEDGLTGFQKMYGDYFVDSFVLGAESAVMLHSSSLDTSTAEHAKIVAEAQFLCFSTETTVADLSFEQQNSSLRFGITAFDSLDGQFVDIGSEDDFSGGLSIQQAQALGSMYAARVYALPRRVKEPMQALDADLGADLKNSFVGWEALRAVTQSGLVLQILLRPFARLRQVQEIVAASAR